MQQKVRFLDYIICHAQVHVYQPVHGQVLAQWPKMFNILSQFCTFVTSKFAILLNAVLFYPVASREQSEAEDDPSAPLKTVAEGERLVRIPLEELQHGNAEKQ